MCFVISQTVFMLLHISPIGHVTMTERLQPLYGRKITSAVDAPMNHKKKTTTATLFSCVYVYVYVCPVFVRLCMCPCYVCMLQTASMKCSCSRGGMPTGAQIRGNIGAAGSPATGSCKNTAVAASPVFVPAGPGDRHCTPLRPAAWCRASSAAPRLARAALAACLAAGPTRLAGRWR